MTFKDLHEYFGYIRTIVQSTATNEHGVRDKLNIELNNKRYGISRISSIVYQIYKFIEWQKNKIVSLTKSNNQLKDVKLSITTKFTNIGFYGYVDNVDRTAGLVCAELTRLKSENAKLVMKLNSAQHTIANAKASLEVYTCDSSHTQGSKRSRTEA